MSGEFDGIRTAEKRLERDLRREGMSEAQAKRQAHETALRADRNIRAGRQPKPTLQD